MGAFERFSGGVLVIKKIGEKAVACITKNLLNFVSHGISHPISSNGKLNGVKVEKRICKTVYTLLALEI